MRLNANVSRQVAFSRGSGGSNLAKVARIKRIKRSAGITRRLSEARTNDLSHRDYVGNRERKREAMRFGLQLEGPVARAVI